MTAADHARRYTELGWALVAIPAGKKGPTTLGWQLPERAISTPEAAQLYWERNPTHNMGLLHSASGTCSIDIDHLEHARFIFAQLGVDLDAILAAAPRIVGRPGRAKAIFRAPSNIKATHKLAWPVKDQPGKSEVIFELRAGAVQDVLPPSMHPDTGSPYEWAGLSYENLPALPDALRIIWEQWDRFRPQFQDMCPWAVKKETFRPPRQRPNNATTSVIDQFNAANDIEDLLAEYHYKRVAPRRYLSPNSGTGLAGVVIFDDGNAYSHHASDPFDNAHSFDSFELFAQYEFSGDISKAVKAAAERLNLVAAPAYVDDTEADAIGKGAIASLKPSKAPKGPLDHIPEHLLSVPGVLQDVVNYYAITAAKEQPQFAVQTALAFGSIVMGRRWVTDQRNYAGLYFVNVGKSATGKEHAKTVLERLLEDAQLDRRIGPSGYTSASGVMSALLTQPTHIAIIDELGRVLQSSKASGNYNKADAQTILMEIFGRQDSTLRPQGFSKMGMRKEDAAELDRFVRRPSLTLFAMTTPSTLYDTISSKYVTDGFLGRFLIVESMIERAPAMMRRQTPPSERLLAWARMCATATAVEDKTLDTDTADQPPLPVEIPFSAECGPMLYAFDAAMMRAMDRVEKIGIEAMYGRTKEIAQRVALIVAVSKGEAEISADSLQWALDYVGHYADATIDALKKSMADSPFEAAAKAVYEKIAASGLNGITEGDISKSVRVFAGLKPIERKAVFENLAADYGIQGRNLNDGKRGRPKIAWFIPAED